MDVFEGEECIGISQPECTYLFFLHLRNLTLSNIDSGNFTWSLKTQAAHQNDEAFGSTVSVESGNVELNEIIPVSWTPTEAPTEAPTEEATNLPTPTPSTSMPTGRIYDLLLFNVSFRLWNIGFSSCTELMEMSRFGIVQYAYLESTRPDHASNPICLLYTSDAADE